MVAGSAAFLGLQFESFLKLLTEFFGLSDALAFVVEHHIVLQILSRIILQIENFLQRANLVLRSAMALQTEAHRVIFRVENNFHLVNLTVATYARNTAVHVSGVAEFHVVRSFVNFHPLNRLTIIKRMCFVHRTMQWIKLGALALHVLVAIPASIGGWQIRVIRVIYKRVAITAIETELIHVNLVRKRNGLRGLIADNSRFGSSVYRKGSDYANGDGTGTDCDFQR